jgi:mannosyltransferase
VTQTTGRSPALLRAPSETMWGPVGGWSAALPRTRRFAGRVLRTPEAIVAVLGLVLFTWRIGTPSAWWDEAITRDIVSRPTGDIVSLVGNIDLVHATYYLLVHLVVGDEAGLTGIRLLSAAAAAATGVLLVRIGRELDATRVGVVAGLAWTIAPLASRYAQEARPYAFVALAVTAATLAMLRVCRKPWLRSRWVAYSAALVVVGLLNVLALLVVSAHLVYVAATASAAVRRRWYLASAAAVAVLLPVLVGSATQRAQVSWLPRPGIEQLLGFYDAQYAVAPAVVALIGLAVAGLGRGTHATALGLGLTWALLPPVLLWTVSQAHPLFDWRYVFFALPGTALALGALATLLRPVYVAVALLVLGALGWHLQQVYRYPASGHAEDVRGAAQVVGTGARAGDAVLFLPSSRRVVKLGYPDEFRSVDDLALAQDGPSSATLWGVETTPSDVAEALRSRTRVWVVTGPRRYGEGDDRTEREKQRLLAGEFRLAQATVEYRYEVRLYVRNTRAVAIPAEDLAGAGN